VEVSFPASFSAACGEAGVAFVVAVFAYLQAKVREQYPGQYANAPHHKWY
jgi:hypothetical protein